MDFYGIPQSKTIRNFRWVGERIPYPEPGVKGDSYPMTWGVDDKIYTSAGDPAWGETANGLDAEVFTGGPEDYKIEKLSHMNDYLGWGGDGPKPTGMLSVDGVLYLAFQNLLGVRKPPHGPLSQHGSDAHIVYRNPRTGLWTPSLKTIEKPMFPGSRFGGPAFVNFGRDNEHARDGYVYAVSGDQWDNGSNVRLGRVPKGNITDRNCWQFLCAFDRCGNPAWHPDLDEAIPILSIHRFIGAPEMAYLADIRRYLFLTWRLHTDFSPDDGTDLLILESPEPWGPFSLVYFEESWEGKEFNPYCPRLPLKWMEPGDTSGYLQFSGSWGPTGQEKNYYRSNVRKFSFDIL